MKLLKVSDRKTERLFLDTARFIYKDDKNWVCPLDKDIKAVFDPSRNPYHNHGIAERWILTDNRRPVGRIAAFIDYNLANSYDQPTGGIGFFECINESQAAFLLFNTAMDWLKKKGMEAMDGPINFGETDKYWGLLVDGFTQPSFDVPYNHPYYSSLYEEYGFKVYYRMEGFHLDIKKPIPDRFLKIAEWVAKKQGYQFNHFTWKDQYKFTNDFAEVFNEAWNSFKTNFEPIKADYIKSVLKKAKHIIDEEFIWFAYHKEKPVAIYLMFPDVNQILKHLNGKMNPISIIKFFYLKNQRKITRAKGLLMGIIPGYQGLGIESAFILKLAEVFSKKPHYNELEFSWVADFNPKMRKIFISVGGIPAKQYVTFRYLFDRTREFKRHPIPEI